ncbi:MAG: hypothetical protein DKINENOH_00282 [bacterium]|nr:hypothetical protein [bacterium]
MRYQEFKNQVRRYPVVTASLLNSLGEDERVLRNQLSRWQKQGLILRLKKGMYLLNREDRSLHPSAFFLANQMVFPSYVSLESALAFYQMIPEAVYQVTSVATGKPAQYVSPEGTFAFRHVKPELFFGFTALRDESGFDILIAEPEKALLDFFYFNLPQFAEGDSGIFAESYRIAGEGILRPGLLEQYAARFSSKKLRRVAHLFSETHLAGGVHA